MQSSVRKTIHKTQWDGVFGAIAIFAASSLLYCLNLDRAPHPDELYHVLSARGILEYGEPRIAEGLYTRTYYFTWLISQFFAFFGEGLVIARVPSLLAVALLGSLIFFWLRSQAGSVAAWIAAGMFVTSPFAIEIAQLTRFYGLQSLSFFTGCIAVYVLTFRPFFSPVKLCWALLALICLATAAYLQETSLIGIAGLALWAGLWLLVNFLGHTQKAVVRVMVLGIIMTLLVLAAVFAIYSGIAGELWQKLRWTPGFNKQSANEFWYYHAWNTLFYPGFWSLIAFISLIALVQRPKAASLALTVFAFSFLINSIAGPKNLRYLVYAQPFLFILIGIGLSALLPFIRQGVVSLYHQLAFVLALPGPLKKPAAFSLIGLAMLFFVAANAASLRSVSLLAGFVIPPEKPPVRWELAKETLEPLLNEVDVVVTTAELETLYYLGDYDVLLSPSRLTEGLVDSIDFSADPRTGRPVINGHAGLTMLFACFEDVLLISNTHRRRNTKVIDDVTSDFIEEHMRPVELPKGSRVLAYYHNSALSGFKRGLQDNCDLIPKLARALP